jgi:hypothetical protein
VNVNKAMAILCARFVWLIRIAVVTLTVMDVNKAYTASEEEAHWGKVRTYLAKSCPSKTEDGIENK